MNWYPPGLCLLELLAPSLFYRSRVLLSSYLMSSPRFTLGCYRHWRWLSLQSIQRRRSNMGTTVYRQLDISPSSTVRCLGPASKKLWAACAESSVTALARGAVFMSLRVPGSQALTSWSLLAISLAPDTMRGHGCAIPAQQLRRWLC